MVVWAVLPMAVADAAAGVPPRSLLQRRCSEPGTVGALGVTRQGGKDQDELGEVYPGARLLGREHVQNARSARALGMHGTRSTKCQGEPSC